MDRYQRVEKPRPESSISENEIRITTQGKMRNYITYATTLLQEKEATEIVLKAMGRAINKTVTIAEIIKRRVAGLHQITSLGSTDITDLWEPLEEGLLPLETTRHVSMITITLSTKDLDKTSVGYQAPLPADQVKSTADYEEYEESSPQEGTDRGRGRGRGSRGRGGAAAPASEYTGPDGSWSRGRSRGRFRGRGHGLRGRGRGFGGEINQEAGVYEDTGDSRESSRGRGRGRGRRGRGRGRGNGADGGAKTSGEYAAI
ncbi:hypothetical protein O6H91_11G058600 [Diphasiastrum complanatum]|uniref:Uncharacterized protein n=10 Tax=Diphasiastrum complanatum TaxID=34168 RepID=A0ACC2C9S4_DIPCM|nr:hypothetical protein O6H91_11G058600 [Diphasiastrum complanatum]KAJ7538667.1 hypothetical protein O6H91_11G058600 [Diphasiastrum complanatum]KAJ7538668.1 hypothetical protein O6H91_11G058600 [Diphasiastrum complanatum]KAJ7538669.1 hypothetical protein O6H91_11G058600 [Diphasiastrum complanatum]KAJ7538670.1 hypothetical protein O6H91_11G058600 [Diphasiastrum complanatum]